jgi:hypothetical protein
MVAFAENEISTEGFEDIFFRSHWRSSFDLDHAVIFPAPESDLDSEEVAELENGTILMERLEAATPSFDQIRQWVNQSRPPAHLCDVTEENPF